MGYNYKNLRLKVSGKWFLKRGLTVFAARFLISEAKFLVKSVHFGRVHSQLFATVNINGYGERVSLFYHAVVILEEFKTPFIKGPLMHFIESHQLLIP